METRTGEDMPYLFLALAIVGELIGTTLLKASEGFTKFIPSIFSIACYVICFYFFSKSLENINLSIAYATWSGIGIIAATLISVFLYKEQISVIGVIGIILIVIGAVILNFYGTSH